MGKSIKSLLEEKGPMLSGELAKIYERENSTTNANARQAISRARSPVQKNKLIPFQNNQVFVYLEKQFMSENYWDRLISAIAECSKTVYVISNALISQGGFVSKNILPAYSMSPVNNLRGHKRYDMLLGKLAQAKIIMDYDDEYIQLTNRWPLTNYSLNISRAKAIEISKKMVLNDFNDLTRKTNVISYNSGKYWSEFAHMQWGFTAPSYLQGISSWHSKKQTVAPGFILADVILQQNASVADVLFFVEKINIIKSFKNISNFVPTLIVYSVMSEAFDVLKKNNIAVAFIDRVFGNTYIELLDDLIYVITNAIAMVLSNPKKIDKIFDALANMDGRYNNIVGDMFELMVAEFYRVLGVNYLEVNKQVSAAATVSGKPKEIDVLVDKDGTIIVAECKATISMINEEFVEKWLSEKIVDIHNFLIGIYPSKKFEYQLWSTGGFATAAAEKLLAVKTKTKRYKVSYFDKSDMVDYAKNNNAQGFLSHIRKHFP